MSATYHKEIIIHLWREEKRENGYITMEVVLPTGVVLDVRGVTPRKATHIIHAKPINMTAKNMRNVVRHRQETGLLDVKMTSYERSYHPRFNQCKSCTTACALQLPQKESVKNRS